MYMVVRVCPVCCGWSVWAARISDLVVSPALVDLVISVNPFDTVYVNVYNSQSANVTVGTTTPQMVLPCPGGATVTYIVPQEVSFSAALTVVAVTAGGTAGTTSMTNSVTIKLLQG